MHTTNQLGTARGALLAVMTAMMVVAALLIAAPASAALHYRYVWKNDSNGSWEDRSNWTCVNPNGGSCNPAEDKGFPNLAGDEAHFTATYTAPHVVSVSASTSRVSKILFGNGQGFTIQSVNAPARIILDSGSSSPTEILTTGDPDQNPVLFNTPFVLAAPLLVTKNTDTVITFNSDISSAGTFGVTFSGRGTARLLNHTTYTGPTINRSGLLQLANPDTLPTLVGSELIVGSGRQDGFSTVEILRPNQLVDTMRVTENGGALEVNANEQIADVSLTSSSLFVNTANLVIRNLVMDNSAVSINHDGRLVLTGNVTATGTQPSDIIQEGGNATLDLGGSSRVFRVDSIRLGISNVAVVGNGSLIKDGPGELAVTGVVPHTYLGETHVVQGKLTLHSAAVVVPGNLFIGQDTQPALVDLAIASIAPSAQVTVGPQGTLLATMPDVQSILSLTIAPGGHVVQDFPAARPDGPIGRLEASNLTMIGGDLDVRQGTLTVTTAVFATSTLTQTALIHGSGSGLFAAPSQIETLDGPQAVELRIAANITRPGGTVRKSGSGVLELASANNNLAVITVASGALRAGIASAIPSTTALILAESASPATLDVNNFDLSIGPLMGAEGGRVLLGDRTLTINQPSGAVATYAGTIAGTGGLVKAGPGVSMLAGSQPNTFTGFTTVQAGSLTLAKTIQNGTIVGPVTVTGGALIANANNQFGATVPITANAPGMFNINNTLTTIASLAGDGEVRLGSGTLTVGSGRSAIFTGTMVGVRLAPGLPPERYFRLIKTGLSTFTLAGTVTLGDQAVVDSGVLEVNGQMSGRGALVRTDGFLAGTGRLLGTDVVNVLSVPTGSGGMIRPGNRIAGILHADAVNLADGYLAIQAAGLALGTNYDQLDLTGDLTISGSARLLWQPTFTPPQGSRFTVVQLAAGHAIAGVFHDMPEGATFVVNGQTFRITYHGGDGNDVVVTAVDGPAAVQTYYLSDGATGTFFDEDVLIANPQDTTAPVTLTFTKDSGEQVVATRSLPARSRLTVHVDQIPGLEDTRVSSQVRSDAGVPLAVERSMFWDQTYAAGHTGKAVDQPAQDWYFAEGAVSDTFDTLVALWNPNATPATLTVTFQREQGPPVQKTVIVGAAARLTLDASIVPELSSHAFGVTIHATQPIIAERSTYFGTNAAHTPSGGTESMGASAASTHWFFSEGATGPFFDTYILLNNPSSAEAHVTLKYVLDTGETVTVPKTVPANARLTTNIEAEGDVRLTNAAVSTIVTSDVPVVAERSMYWPGTRAQYAEGHTSFGVVDAGTKWGLAEGRSGGPLHFHTYILLANPQTTAATVRITYVREGGTPVVQTYTVPATSRLNIDTDTIASLQDSSYGALVEVTNQVPIVVERSMYWDSNGVAFSGGTNATGTRLP